MVAIVKDRSVSFQRVIIFGVLSPKFTTADTCLILKIPDISISQALGTIWQSIFSLESESDAAITCNLFNSH